MRDRNGETGSDKAPKYRKNEIPVLFLREKRAVKICVKIDYVSFDPGRLTPVGGFGLIIEFEFPGDSAHLSSSTRCNKKHPVERPGDAEFL